MQMDQKPVDLNVLQNHPEMSVLDVKNTSGIHRSFWSSHRWNHPYFDEIEAFEPDESALKRVELQFPKPIEETKCLYVDDLDKLKVLMDHIEMQRELAIDLEVGVVRVTDLNSRPGDDCSTTRTDRIKVSPVSCKYHHGRKIS